MCKRIKRIISKRKRRYKTSTYITSFQTVLKYSITLLGTETNARSKLFQTLIIRITKKIQNWSKFAQNLVLTGTVLLIIELKTMNSCKLEKFHTYEKYHILIYDRPTPKT